MPSINDQSKTNLKALKAGTTRPFFIACDGQRTVFFIAKKGTLSQFKDLTKINSFISSNKLGEALSAKAKVGAGTVQRSDGTCYFDLSIKKGVSTSILQKTLNVTKRSLQIKSFELGKPDTSAPAATAAPSSSPELDAIKAQLKKINSRGKTISSLIDSGLKKDGSGFDKITDLASLRAEMKQLSSMKKNLKSDLAWLEGAIKDLKKATDKESVELRARLEKTHSRASKLFSTVQDLGSRGVARKDELGIQVPLEETIRDLSNPIKRLLERAQNIQNALGIRTGSDGANLGRELSFKNTREEVLAVQATFQQHRTQLVEMQNRIQNYTKRMNASAKGVRVTPEFTDLQEKLNAADMIVGNTIDVVIDQTVAKQINDRLSQL